MNGQISFANGFKLVTMRVALLMFSIVLLSSGCQAKQKEHAAEQKLDQLLGQNGQSEDVQPDAHNLQPFPDPLANAPQDSVPDQNNQDAFSGFPDWAKNMLPGQPDIQVKEETSQYRVVVNLSNPKDANSVKVTALPHRVEVSGQSSFGKDGLEGSSSFFKSFTTSAELLPNQMKREQHERTLEFLIPKKVASQPMREQGGQQQPTSIKQTPAPNISPDVLEQLNRSENRAI